MKFDGKEKDKMVVRFHNLDEYGDESDIYCLVDNTKENKELLNDMNAALEKCFDEGEYEESNKIIDAYWAKLTGRIDIEGCMAFFYEE